MLAVLGGCYKHIAKRNCKISDLTKFELLRLAGSVIFVSYINLPVPLILLDLEINS